MADLGNINKLKLPNGDIVHFKDSVSGYTSNTGTITQVTTSAGAHTTVNKSSGAVSFNVPTKTSHLSNDSGFITDISGKADKATTLSGYGITDAYTKTEIDGKLSGAFHYKGSKAAVGDLPSSGNATGDVWHINADGSEYAWNGSSWEFLGKVIDLSGYVPTSRTVNGKALSSNISLSASDVGALASSHTYDISLATSSDTSTVSLSANTKYKLTAGGKSIVFTTPADSAPVTSVNGQTGAVNLSASNVGALPTGHTYTTKIEGESSASSSVTLAFGSKYKLTAGGTSYVFTMPSNPNTNTTYSLTQDSTDGHKITLTPSSGSAQTITIPDNNTTYSAGTGLSLSGTSFSVKTGYTTSGNNRAVQADSNGNLYVTQKDTTYSVATNSTSGLVKPWYTHTAASTGPTTGTNDTAVAVNAITTTAGKYYAVEADNAGRLFVNVPWTDHTYTLPTSAANHTTGITIANHSTTQIAGVSGSTSVYGVKSTTTTASKASGSNSTTPSLSFAIDSTDTNQLNITWSAGTASSWSFSNVTVPVKDDNATTVPTAASAITVVTGASHSITDNGHTHTLA